jgi:secondary thiamine-phosphate synthase enzyme
MIFLQKNIFIHTPGRSIIDITEQVQTVVSLSTAHQGLCHLFLRHTSASLIFCENADPTVLRDLEAFMSRLVHDGDKLFLHTEEGKDDMSAHVRTVLTQNSLTIPIAEEKLMLGTWQGIFLWEHRLASKQRQIVITVTGVSGEN